MSWHMSPRYGNVRLVSGYPVWQLSIDHIVNGQYKRYGFAKTHLRHPSLPFDSLPYPTRTICRRVRTYARSVTWQPNEKRLTMFYEYGALSHARFAREGAPLLQKGLWSIRKKSSLHWISGFFCLHVNLEDQDLKLCRHRSDQSFQKGGYGTVNIPPPYFFSQFFPPPYFMGQFLLPP